MFRKLPFKRALFSLSFIPPRLLVLLRKKKRKKENCFLFSFFFQKHIMSTFEVILKLASTWGFSSKGLLFIF